MSKANKTNRYNGSEADGSKSSSTLRPTLDLSALNLNITEARVRKLYTCSKKRKSPRDRVVEAGLNPDDVYSDILLGLCTRAAGKSRYDESRGMAVTTYVYMVITSVVNNAIAASIRNKRSMFVLGNRCDVAITAETIAQYEDEYNDFGE